ncbi:MAG: hypothetical protein M3R35_05645 [Candidatus Eremiobacteraeota bacterium]|nr:hypothetical protein [Candidatus Eremiobacteraeota bacterium]
MAIRGVDLQLSYLAAPQNAAVADHAQNAPQAAQSAAQAAFAAQLKQREEQIEQTAKGEGNRVKTRSEDQPETQRGKPRKVRRGAAEPEFAAGSDGEDHFIDVTA